LNNYIFVTPRADRDLDEQFMYLAQRSQEVAGRYFQACQSTFALLAQSPLLGALSEVSNPRLAEMRVWRIRGFEKYLIFYRPVDEGIEIIRVLHGARDIEAVFDEEL
jgi:toxin ParE1/3/4